MALKVLLLALKVLCKRLEVWGGERLVLVTPRPGLDLPPRALRRKVAPGTESAAP